MKWLDLEETLSELAQAVQDESRAVRELERERIGEGCYRRRKLPNADGQA